MPRMPESSAFPIVREEIRCTRRGCVCTRRLEPKPTSFVQNVITVDIPTEKPRLRKCLCRRAEKRTDPAGWLENRIRFDSLLNQ